jgi:hypothetical protein
VGRSGAFRGVLGRFGAFWGIQKRKYIYFKKSAKVGSQKMATGCHFFKKKRVYTMKCVMEITMKYMMEK